LRSPFISNGERIPLFVFEKSTGVVYLLFVFTVEKMTIDL